MDVLLIAGLWLDGSVWRDVASALERLGHRRYHDVSGKVVVEPSTYDRHSWTVRLY